MEKGIHVFLVYEKNGKIKGVILVPGNKSGIREATEEARKLQSNFLCYETFFDEKSKKALII